MVPRKLVEIAFRRIALLALPVVAAPVLAFLLVPSSTKYASSATVWVSEPAAFDGTGVARTENPFVTPAELQTRVLQDLLATRSFRESIALDAGLVESGDETALKNLAIERVGASIEVEAVGDNLVGITATSGSADQAFDLTTSFLAAYDTWASETLSREAEIAVTYFSQQVALAQAELDTREAALTAYLRLAPNAAAAFPPDVDYLALAGRVEAQRGTVEGLLASLQQARLDVASTESTLAASFSVQDRPDLPDAPLQLSPVERFAAPAIGLVFGVVIAGGYVFLAFRTDHTIRSGEDLDGLDTRVLAYIPLVNTIESGATPTVSSPRRTSSADLTPAYDDQTKRGSLTW